MDDAMAVLGSRGRITVPLEVRQALAVQAGDRLRFVQLSPGRYEVTAESPRQREIRHSDQLDLGLQQNWP